MTRRFCESCGKEIPVRCSVANGTVLRRQTTINAIPLTVKFEYDNADDLCLYCIIDAIKRLDDRPQPSKFIAWSGPAGRSLMDRNLL